MLANYDATNTHDWCEHNAAIEEYPERHAARVTKVGPARSEKLVSRPDIFDPDGRVHFLPNVERQRVRWRRRDLEFKLATKQDQISIRPERGSLATDARALRHLANFCPSSPPRLYQ